MAPGPSPLPQTNLGWAVCSTCSHLEVRLADCLIIVPQIRGNWKDGISFLLQIHKELSRKVPSLVSRKEIFPFLHTWLKREKPNSSPQQYGDCQQVSGCPGHPNPALIRRDPWEISPPRPRKEWTNGGFLSLVGKLGEGKGLAQKSNYFFNLFLNLDFFDPCRNTEIFFQLTMYLSDLVAINLTSKLYFTMCSILRFLSAQYTNGTAGGFFAFWDCLRAGNKVPITSLAF